MSKIVICAIALCSLLSGCVSVSNVKSLTIPASNHDVAVTAKARAECQDFLFIMHCTLYLEMEASNGLKVTDFPQAAK